MRHDCRPSPQAVKSFCKFNQVSFDIVTRTQILSVSLSESVDSDCVGSSVTCIPKPESTSSKGRTSDAIAQSISVHRSPVSTSEFLPARPGNQALRVGLLCLFRHLLAPYCLPQPTSEVRRPLPARAAGRLRPHAESAAPLGIHHIPDDVVENGRCGAVHLVPQHEHRTTVVRPRDAQRRCQVPQ